MIWIGGALLLMVAGLAVIAGCTVRFLGALRSLAREVDRVQRIADRARGARIRAIPGPVEAARGPVKTADTGLRDSQFRG